MGQVKKRLRNASFLLLRYIRWPCTKQPSWNFSNNFFQPNYSFELKLDRRYHATWRLKINSIINSYLGIPQTTSSNPYFFLSIKLMGVFKAKWRPWIALIIPSRCQRWPSIGKPSWNSSNNIFLQTIYPNEQKLYWMRQAKKRLRIASFILLRFKRW